MAHSSPPPLLAQLQGAGSFAEQASAFRALGHDMIGHPIRKEAWIQHGALDVVVAVICTVRTSQFKPSGDRVSYSSHHVARAVLPEEELVRLRALQLVASFVRGGPDCLEPLFAAQAITAVLDNLCPYTNPPVLVLAALRAMVCIADSALLSPPSCSVNTGILADSLFSPLYCGWLETILSVSPAAGPIAREQINLVADLIGRLCREEPHQLAFADSPIMESLSRLVVLFAKPTMTGEIAAAAAPVYTLTSRGRLACLGQMNWITESGQSELSFATILDAVSAIMTDSRYRAFKFLWSAAVRETFPIPSRRTDSASRSLVESDRFHHGRSHGPTDNNDPIIPSSKAFWITVSQESLLSRHESGPVPSSLTPSKPGSRRLPTDGSVKDPDNADTFFLPWLIQRVRSRGTDLDRLAAAGVLTSLLRVHAPKHRSSAREITQGLQEAGRLMVPVIVEMLAKCNVSSTIAASSAELVDSDTARAWAVLERAPTVLARLTSGRDVMQKIAKDCKAIETLSRLLKDSFDSPLPTRPPIPWSPHPIYLDESIDGTMKATDQVSEAGQPWLMRRLLRVREATLKAIGALAGGGEEFRKGFREEDAISYVAACLSLSWDSKKPVGTMVVEDKADPQLAIETTETFQAASQPVPPPSSSPFSPQWADMVPVVKAACHVVRTLSRSPCLLRTSLVDLNVSTPIFLYLRSPDVELQIAAAAAMCNLVVSMSPMREQLIERGLVSVLCEQARSPNAIVRLNALWALKHLVNEATVEMKKACLEELEPGWLVQMVDGDADVIASDGLSSSHDNANVIRRHRHSAGGDARELDRAEDVEMISISAEVPLLSPLPLSIGTSVSAVARPIDGQARARVNGVYDNGGEDRDQDSVSVASELEAMREAEVSAVKRARMDDLAIQEQGLDFIRNLIGLSKFASLTDTADMIDFLLRQLGVERLFDMLARKLQPRPVRPFGGWKAGSGLTSSSWATNETGPDLGSERRVIYPPWRIVEGAVMVLVHMSASTPAHKQLVVSQTRLLDLVLKRCVLSADASVRIGFCHLVANLVCDESPADNQGRWERAQELSRLGFVDRVTRLRRDPELSVKQLAAMTEAHLKKALKGWT